MNSDRLKQLVLSLGTHRTQRPLSPVEAGLRIAELSDELGSITKAAKVIHLDVTTARRFAALTKVTPEIRPLIGWGASRDTLSFSSAAEIVGLSRAEQIETARAAIENRMTKEELRAAVQLRKRSGKSMSDCIAKALHMRPQVEFIHVFLGSTGDDPGVDGYLLTLTQNERDGILRDVFSSTLNCDASGRLTEKGFSAITVRELTAAEAHRLEAKVQAILKDRAG